MQAWTTNWHKYSQSPVRRNPIPTIAEYLLTVIIALNETVLLLDINNGNQKLSRKTSRQLEPAVMYENDEI